MVFWVIVIYYLMTLSIGTVFQVYLSLHKRNNLGKILPFIIFLFDTYLGAFNFYYAFVPRFNFLVLLLSLGVYLFLLFPAFFYLAIERSAKERKRRYKKQKRKQNRK